MNLVFRLAVFLAFIPAFASAQLVPVTNILFQNSVTADQGLFNNITGSTVSATTITAGSLGVGNITASGNISASGDITVSNGITATTGTFTEINIGGGNLEEALFPLTQDADLGGFSLTNGATVQAVTGKFDSVILGGGNIEDALFPLTKDADLGGFSLTNGATVQAVTGKFDQVILGGGNLEEALFPLTTNANFNGFNLVNGGNIDADSLEFDGGTGTLNSVTIEDGTASFSSISFASGTGTLDTVTISGGTGTFDEVNATVLDATSSTLDTVTISSGGTGTLNSLTVLDSSSFGGSFTVGGDMTVESNLTVNQSFSSPTASFANVETDFLELDGPFIFSAVDWIHYASLENTNNFLYADDGYFSNQIVRLDGVLWQAGKDLPNADYYPWNTNCVDGSGPCAYPVPGVSVGDSTNWVPVSRGLDGQDGAKGDPGEDGLDGLGNVQYGIFDNTRTYIYDTNTPIVVSHDGRWYDLIQSVTNSPAPDSASGPTYWSISVDKGLDGEIIGSSNLVYRGVWDVGENYTTNDVVQYQGNLFTVDPTNQVPPLTTAPSIGADQLGQNSAYWTLHLSRGVRGLTGAKGNDGADGSSVTNFTYYYISTNPPPLHQQNGPNPGPTNRIYQWHSITNGTNFYRWDGIVPVSSNYLEDVDGVLHYVVGSNSTPVGSGSGNASLTSAWSVVYSDGSTNSISLPLGVSNSVLMSTGANSAPEWSTNVTLSTGGGGGGGDVYLASNNVFTATNIFNERVGIGTNDPQADLHVVDDARIDGDLYINGNQIYTDNNLMFNAGSLQRISIASVAGPPTAGNQNAIIANRHSGSLISASTGGNVILGGGQFANKITGLYADSVILGGGANDLNGVNNSIIAGGYDNEINKTSGNHQGYGIYNSRQSRIYTTADSFIVDASIIIGGVNSIITNSYGSILLKRGRINHNNVFMYSDDSSFTSQNTNTILFSAKNGMGINTNNPQADLHVNGPIKTEVGYIFPDGTTQTTAAVSGGGGGGSVTNPYAFFAKIDETNTLRFTDGSGQFFDIAFSTNALPTNGIDVVSVEPEQHLEYNTVSTNVSGEWVIDLGEGEVLDYAQTGAITNIVISTPYSNRVSTARVTLLTDTNAITFPTNGWVWAGGSYPTTVNSNYNIFYLERSRFGKIHAAYVGTEDL